MRFDKLPGREPAPSAEPPEQSWDPEIPRVRRRAAATLLLAAALLVGAPPAEAATMKERVAEARRRVDARREALRQRIAAVGHRVRDAGDQALEMTRELAEQVMACLKGRLGQIADQARKAGRKVDEIWDRYTERKIVVALLRVQGSGMHVIADPDRSWLDKARDLVVGGRTYISYPIVLEMRRDDPNLLHFEKAMIEGMIDAMEYTGTTQPPSWVGYWVATGKHWNRPVITEASPEDQERLRPLIGNPLPIPGR